MTRKARVSRSYRPAPTPPRRAPHPVEGLRYCVMLLSRMFLHDCSAMVAEARVGGVRMGRLGRVVIMAVLLAAIGGCQLSNPRIFVTPHDRPTGPFPQR